MRGAYTFVWMVTEAEEAAEAGAGTGVEAAAAETEMTAGKDELFGSRHRKCANLNPCP